MNRISIRQRIFEGSILNIGSISIKLIAALLIFGVFGCNRPQPMPTNVSDVRGEPPNVKTVELDIPREIYKDTLKNPGRLVRMRIVPLVARSDQTTGIPEYRLFSITPDSPGYLLGLREGDVLVSANDYIIWDPRKFKTYLYLLQNEKEARIEVRRGDESILFKYKFS